MLRRPVLVVFDSGDNHHDIGLRRLGHLEVRAASFLAMPILAVRCTSVALFCVIVPTRLAS